MRAGKACSQLYLLAKAASGQKRTVRWSVYWVSLTVRPSRARLSLECGNQSLNSMPERQPREP